MKFLSFESKVFFTVLLVITYTSSMFSTALDAGSVQITTNTGNFAGYLSEEIKIPFEVSTGGNIAKLTLEATSASKDIIPGSIKNLYIITTGSAIKANPTAIANANGKYSGTVYAKASTDFIKKNAAGSTIITLIAKTDKNQVAQLKLNVTFDKKTLTYSKNIAVVTFPMSVGEPKAGFIGYVYSTEGFTQGLSAADFANDCKTNTDATSTLGVSATSKPTIAPSPSPTPSTSASSTEATSSSGTGSGAQRTSTAAQISSLLSVLLLAILSFLAYFLKEFKTTTSTSDKTNVA